MKEAADRGGLLCGPPAGHHDRSGSIASFWGCAGHFRSTPINRHLQTRLACLISATLGLMHCGKSTPRDHLIGMRGKFCASAISTRRWRYFFLDARVEEACAYDRVEHADRGARHEANAQLDRRSKLDQAVPSRPHPESLPRPQARGKS